MLSQEALETLFLEARTHNKFRPDPIDPALLTKLYDLAKMGPTEANSQPLRVAFVVSKEAKAKLGPCMSDGNREKTLSAPATAIFAYDIEFQEQMPTLFPHQPGAKDWFGDESNRKRVAYRSSSLQAAYFMLAARALGLDTGPMAGFDGAKIDETFFAGTTWRTNFLCNLGHGDASVLHPRNPRLSADFACKIL